MSEYYCHYLHFLLRFQVVVEFLTTHAVLKGKKQSVIPQSASGPDTARGRAVERPLRCV